MTIELPLDRVTRDLAMQMRMAGLDVGVVTDYAEAMESGAAFPPVVVFTDGDTHWLADGFHRFEAAVRAGRERIEADVRDGTRRDAILFAAGANAFHGMRRTSDDKRRSVLSLLNDPDWSHWSDREIGKRCAVDHKTVGKIRREVVGYVPTERTYTTKHGTVSTMQTSAVESAEAVAHTMVERMLAKAETAALVAECRRRGLEVSGAD